MVVDLPLPFTYQFPDITVLMDLLYISRSSAVRSTLQTLAPIQSPHPSPKIFLAFLCFFGLPVFLLVLISPVFMRFAMFLFRVDVSHPYVPVGNTHARVRIIRNFILLFVAFPSFSMSINFLHTIASVRLISCVQSPSV